MFLKGSVATAGLMNVSLAFAGASTTSKLKVIPATGEKIHPIGMGTWKTFNVGRDEHLMYERTKVLSTFFSMGGQMIDSSPMYGSSEAVVGWALNHLTNVDGLFCATKTWSRSAYEGKRQFSDSQMLWEKRRLDLVQVHNLLAWEDQLAMLRELK